jgi:hypothetical protein
MRRPHRILNQNFELGARVPSTLPFARDKEERWGVSTEYAQNFESNFEIDICADIRPMTYGCSQISDFGFMRSERRKQFASVDMHNF